jgi:peroxiredoxin Q/BCP
MGHEKRIAMRRLFQCALWVALFLSIGNLPADPPRDFKVTSAIDDSVFELEKHRGKVVVLHFLLKTECPYCLRYTYEYAVLAEKQPDVEHVFLKPDTVDDIRKWSERMDETGLKDQPKIYRDADAALAKAFDIPDGYKFHGQVVHYPALIILDGQGVERYRYVGKSNADRLSTGEFLKALRGMQKPMP